MQQLHPRPDGVPLRERHAEVKSRVPGTGGHAYLLLRSGQPLLDADGQFPGRAPFPHLGHVRRRGGLPGGAEGERRGGQEAGGGGVVEGDPLLWKPTVRKTRRRGDAARCA